MNNQFRLQNAANGVTYGTFFHFAGMGLTHAVSTRLHGTSNPPYNSLNLGINTGDDPAKVAENRRLFSEAAGINAQNVVTAQQVHSDHVMVIAQSRAPGLKDIQPAIPGTDALITNIPGVPLMLFFADCVPVLIYDPVRKAIGISHAGWKGTVLQIAVKTIRYMAKAYGTKPQDCHIGIGPSIGPCCYEVDQTVINILKREFPREWECLVKSQEKDKWLFNLWETNRMQLRNIGVNPDNIVSSGVCTACHTDLFYSHRAERGTTGRLGAVIQL